MDKLFIIFLLCLPLFGWAGKDGDIKVLKKGDEIYLQGYGRERGVVGTVQGKVRGD